MPCYACCCNTEVYSFVFGIGCIIFISCYCIIHILEWKWLCSWMQGVPDLTCWGCCWPPQSRDSHRQKSKAAQPVKEVHPIFGGIGENHPDTDNLCLEGKMSTSMCHQMLSVDIHHRSIVNWTKPDQWPMPKSLSAYMSMGWEILNWIFIQKKPEHYSLVAPVVVDIEGSIVPRTLLLSGFEGT